MVVHREGRVYDPHTHLPYIYRRHPQSLNPLPPPPTLQTLPSPPTVMSITPGMTISPPGDLSLT